jgi:hypothetical protein
MAAGVQIHEQFPENMEALKFLVQIAGELQDQGKRAQYECKLQKVERVLAMREDIPKPSSRQAECERDAVSAMFPAQNHAAGTGTRQLAGLGEFEQGLGGYTLLPEAMAYQTPANACVALQATRGKAQVWEEELGANLLPGLD